MRSFVPVVFILAAVSVAALRDPNYGDEASEVKNMMESVRHSTEGGSSGTPQEAPSAHKSSIDVAQFSELDSELMARADRIQADLQARDSAPAKPLLKKAALTARKQSTHHDLAARFFAAHGMQDVGRMLGDELPEAAAKPAQEEAEETRRLLAEPSKSMHTVEAAAVPVASGLDVDMAEEEDEKAYKAKWQAVDALRHRAPRV
mmetsp:Transcript_35888/g.78595  ORF Transcript_35888/g.78595 Transcript_35888/m.78595 type:complete len:204 (-) Transcript_35888:55-666(-)